MLRPPARPVSRGHSDRRKTVTMTQHSSQTRGGSARSEHPASRPARRASRHTGQPAASRTAQQRPAAQRPAQNEATDSMAARTDAPTFASLGVPEPIVHILADDGKTTAFPIQADTLPDTLRGRDVLGRGRTGSGKTLSFGIPLVSRLAGAVPGTEAAGRTRPGHPRALVLAPTRELATQIDDVIAPLADAYGLRSTTIFGGVKPHRQIQALESGVDIIVACPGRLEDLMHQGHVALDAIEITVLDEADRMADMGFLPAVTRILAATPGRGQRMFFSATLDNGIDRLVKRFLHDPILHSVDEASSPVSTMTHHVFEVSGSEEKKTVVRQLARGVGRRILFMRTKHHAKRLARQLTAAGIPAVDLQGNLSQNARERNLGAFESGRVHVLVATDVAARGIDVPEVELVVHVDPPTEHKAYLHRSGRTARAGHTGDVVTIVLPEERRDVKQMLRQAGIRATPVQVDADSPEVAELVGEVAPYVEPTTPVVAAPQPQKRQGRGKSRRRGDDGQARDGQGGRGGSGRGASGRGDSGRNGSSRGRDEAGRGGRNGRGQGGQGGGRGSDEGRGDRSQSRHGGRNGHGQGGRAPKRPQMGQLAGARGHQARRGR